MYGFAGFVPNEELTPDPVEWHALPIYRKLACHRCLTHRWQRHVQHGQFKCPICRSINGSTQHQDLSSVDMAHVVRAEGLADDETPKKLGRITFLRPNAPKNP